MQHNLWYMMVRMPNETHSGDYLYDDAMMKEHYQELEKKKGATMTEITIPVSKCSIGDDELRAVSKVFDSAWLGMGVQVAEFEKELEKFLGAKHVVCTNTGTTALHLALESIGIKKGDEVIVPAFTYIASIQAITATGATPVFCDVDPGTLNLSLSDVKRKITERTKAVMPVYYRGFPYHILSLKYLARQHHLKIVEDACHAFGTEQGMGCNRVGSFKDVISCFSFDPIKNITCGEGGAVAFQEDSLLETMQLKRLLGVNRDTLSRYKNKRSWYYDVVTQGYRYHMSNINAAIGLAQLKKFEQFNNRKIEVAKRYDESFGDLADIGLLDSDYDGVGLFMYVIRVKKGRDDLMDYLTSKGIGSGIHYIPAHLFTFCKQFSSGPLPVTEKAYREILTLPLFPGITEEQVEQVISAVKSWKSH